MSKAFMVTGGGVGAKMGEATLHFCAAGCGPDELHVLFIDPDTANGNVARAVNTIKAYAHIQAWPWAVSSGAEDKPPLNLFRTRIFRYDLTQPIESMKDGGLSHSAHGNQALQQLLELLYDPEERTTKCLDGFRARPNLGCLVLSDHIKTHLAAPEGYESPKESILLEQGGQARDFVSKLGEALAGNELCPVLVVGSVFGGMGASLHPIIEKLICDALTARHYGNQDKLRWAHLMVLPYFMPRAKDDSVDPDRYLLDTKIALRFYDLSNWVQGRFVYLVGSQEPGADGKQVATHLGSSAQKNPAFVEEAVGAVAALDFIGKPDQEPATMVWAVEAGEMNLNQLPNHGVVQTSGRMLREHLACVLHLAAFFLRGGEGRADHQQGLQRFLDQAKKRPGWLLEVGWYNEILGEWAKTMKHAVPALANVKGGLFGLGRRAGEAGVLLGLKDTNPHVIESGVRLAAEYFGRLLYWAMMVLAGADARMMRFADKTNQGYPSVHGTMCSISADLIEQTTTTRGYMATEDNAMGRVLRTALVAMLREYEQGVGPSTDLRFAPFTDAAASQIQLHVLPEEVSEGLKAALGIDPAIALYEDYWPSAS